MELSLSGPVGQVYALVVGNDLLFAGTQVNSSSKLLLFLVLYNTLCILIIYFLRLQSE